jgi:uncharacterized protein
MKINILILPGIGSSGPQHWQTLWEQSNPSFVRVHQSDWNTPVCTDWISELERAVAQAGPETILVAHSMGCLLVAHWAAVTTLSVKSALLVAVPDPDCAAFPGGTTGFSRLPHDRLPFQSIVVSSSNDRFGSADFNRRCAAYWGSRFVSIGAAGHINAESNLGDWPQGFELLKGLDA